MQSIASRQDRCQELTFRMDSLSMDQPSFHFQSAFFDFSACNVLLCSTSFFQNQTPVINLLFLV